MKNAMKKIMSLVLVAMILVSAVPFGASADETTGPWLDVVVGDTTVIHTWGGVNEPLTIAGMMAAANVAAENVEVVLLNGQAFTGNDFTLGAEQSTTTVRFVMKPEPQEPQEPQGPQVANLLIYRDSTLVYSTTGQPNEAVSITACLPYASLAADQVEAVYLDGAACNLATAFNLGAAGETTTVKFVEKVIPEVANLKVYLGDTLVYSTTGAPYEVVPVANCLVYTALTADQVSAIYLNDAALAASSFALGANGSTTTIKFVKKAAASTNTNTNTNTNTGNNYNANTGNVTNTTTSYSKFAYPVYLNIYTDTTVGTVKKTINITNGIAADGKVTLSEVKNLVPNYYTAEVAATGIIYDGLYPAQGNWVLDYVVDQKYDIIEGLYEAASNNYVYINVMLTNAKALSTSTSTSTNPKTGDEIYMVGTVMALSACALATAFYFTKKRAI